MKNTLKFYPVGNGDFSVIQLQDKTSIVVDCNIRQPSTNGNCKTFDVKNDLLRSIERRNDIPFVDVFILTHGDCDHCRGYKTHFYQGDPSKYSPKNRELEQIIIDEMWFSPMIAEEHSNDDEEAYQLEAERRLAMHRCNHPERNSPGNRIKIVGYDKNKDYSDLNHLRAIPGNVVSVFNGRNQQTFSLFIHAPFKEHLVSAEKDRNSTSIVFQARFKADPSSNDFICLAMFGGDSDHYSWQVILEKTRKYNNDRKEHALNWDVFIAPHHCSWSFFNDRPQKEHPVPTATALEVLSYKRADAKIIASSKQIFDDDDNPPHYAAKREYIKRLENSANFLNTAEEPSASAPQPIVFEVGITGIQRIESQGIDSRLYAAIAVSTTSVIQKPWFGNV